MTVLDWLLDSDPAIRWQALRDLADAPPEVVAVERRVDGCLRFSFVPAGSTTPQQYRCQPALEVETEIDARRRAAQASGQVHVEK